MSGQNKSGYDATVDQLCDRFRGRGAAANARDEAGRQNAAGREAPNAYFLSRMDRGEIPPKFSVGRFDPRADTIVMPAQKTAGKVKGRIRRLFEKWFPADTEKKREEGKKKKNIPVAMIGFIVSVAAAMSMIVGTTVMSGEAQSQVGTLKSEIKSLEAERLRLEEELVRKDDLAMISDYAEEKLGMIRKDYVSSVYLPSAEGDSVQATEKKDGKGLASLLSAIYGG